MNDQPGREYYLAHKAGLLDGFDQEARHWQPVMAALLGAEPAGAVLKDARERFEALIPQIPYIGGDENHLTGSLIGSARCLALYMSMRLRGRTAEETGKVLYDAIVARIGQPAPPSGELTADQLMERRRARAERSQERRYPHDYVYEFVAGDGGSFDYGYNFTACAAQRFYRAQGADEFMPFYCYLDFPESRLYGTGLTRTMALGEGQPLCNHRFKKGREAPLLWPPPFLGQAQRVTSSGGYAERPQGGGAL